MINISSEVVPTENYILKRISQADIFEYYLGVRVQTDRMFKSPLRRDKNPTCNFSWYNGKLYYRDWAWPKPLDCFSLVVLLFNCNFEEALNKIASDFKLYEKEVSTKRVKEIKVRKEKNNIQSEKEKSRINISLKNIEYALDYFTLYGISRNTLDLFNVFGIRKAWVNGQSVYVFDSNDPCVGYYFGKDSDGNQRWKLYFYTRTNGTRFICNTNRINGWIQLKVTKNLGDVLIITKSLKDVMALYELGYPSIAMQNETTIPYPRIVSKLEDMFSDIVTLYDYDDTGITTSKEIQDKYEIRPIYLKKAKDASDYIKAFGKEKTANKIEYLIHER
jgi:hypothetical protein